MSPRFVLVRENVQCAAEVVNRSLKADCADFKRPFSTLLSKKNTKRGKGCLVMIDN